ncbi:MAG: hypothetical protein V3V01_12815, partial [Acidimicrobiales bacterium]
MDRVRALHEPGATAVRVGRLFDPVSESKALLWDAPGAGTLAWIAAHLTASVVFLVTLLTAAAQPRWVTLILVLWVALLSVLVGRVTLAVLFSKDDEFRVDSAFALPLVTSPVRAALFVALAYAAFVVPLGISSTLVGASVGFVAVTSGARFAGVDAWEGSLQPRWHYVRSVVSKSGLVAVLAFVALSGLVFAVLARYTELLASADVATILTGARWSLGRQFFELMLVALSPIIPTLVVCEIISAIARYDSNLRRRVTFVERMNERIGVGDDIHDGPL